MEERMHSEIFVCLVCAQLVLPAAIAAETKSSVKERWQLSVEETIGAVFLGLFTEGGEWTLCSRANPGARAVLWGILGDKGQEMYHGRGRAFRMMGYIGGPDDVAKLAAALPKSGRMNREFYRGEVTGIFQALGLMSRRGIGEADTMVERMAKPEFWKGRELKWYGDDVLGKYPYLELETRYKLLEGYALSESAKVAELSKLITDAIEDPETRKRARERLGRLPGLARGVRGEENARVPRQLRKELGDLYRRSVPILAHLLPSSLDDEEAAFIRSVLKEAEAELARIRHEVANEKFDALKGRLLERGEIISAKDYAQLWPEYRSDLRVAQPAFKALGQLRSRGRDYTVQHLFVYEFPAKPSGAGEKIPGTKREEVSVSFALNDSAEIGRVLFPQARGSLTVAKDGTLVVFMKRVDGKWYWQPFGWGAPD